MIKKILVADDDLDAHELVRDILQISFKQVKIDRAMSSKSFMKKIRESKNDYDLILFNIRLKHDNGSDVLSSIQVEHPDLMERIVLLADSPDEQENPLGKEIPYISKPFSLDYFGEVVKKVCNN
jgi:DNA-binding NtrC family response regulator